jgi:lauroyl/myristoyl acyltransferase
LNGCPFWVAGGGNQGIHGALARHYTGKSKEEIRDNTIIMTQWLERTVRKYPDQWNWMNIRWSDSSPAAVNNHQAKKD